MPIRRARYLQLHVASTVGIGVVLLGGHTMLVLTTAQKVPLTVAPLDQYGNPAIVDGYPVWQTSDPTVGTLSVSADGLTAVFTTTGTLGLTQVSAQADADLGAGTRPITATLDISVEASEAVSLSIKAGAPEPK